MYIIKLFMATKTKDISQKVTTMKGSIACIFIFYLYSTNAVSHNNILHQIINHVNGTSNTIRFSNIETLLNELSFKNCNKEKTIHCSLVSLVFIARFLGWLCSNCSENLETEE